MPQDLVARTIGKFQEQFSWVPEVQNASALPDAKQFIIAGMGGSGLAPTFIASFGRRSVIAHKDYGLPVLPLDFEKNGLVIASSFSGTTEETIDAVQEALRKKLPVAVVASGGDLIALAQKHTLPYIVIPRSGLEPRMAVGYSMIALSTLMKDRELTETIASVGRAIDPFESKEDGIALGKKLHGCIPWIYASADNGPLAYFCKIKFNENAKIPAVSGEIPELCHNDLCGFDVAEATKELSSHVHVVMFEDRDDHPRIQKRCEVMRQLLTERGIAVTTVPLRGKGFEKLLSGSLLMDWASLYLGVQYGVPVTETPLVFELKKRLAH